MGKPEGKTRANIGYLIHDICDIFNKLKGYSAGYTTSRSGQMLFSKDGDIYKLSIEKISDGEEVTIDTIERHLG